jgi:nitroimidazol reductase NimA-like FMN-containing flavoprotein (pyridoxamine 5'-phosphate oxidase superfamily)
MGRIIANKSEIEEILTRAKVGRLGMCLNNKPYVVPIGFVYHNGKIYFHSTNKGRKIQIMKANPSVCFEVDEYELVPNQDPCKFTFHYCSVIAFGKVRFLETKKDKLAVLNVMMNKYDPSHIAKPLNESMINDLVIGEISIRLITGKRNP